MTSDELKTLNRLTPEGEAAWTEHRLQLHATELTLQTPPRPRPLPVFKRPTLTAERDALFAAIDDGIDCDDDSGVSS
jgi:hypothetical protein